MSGKNHVNENITRSNLVVYPFCVVLAAGSRVNISASAIMARFASLQNSGVYIGTRF